MLIGRLDPEGHTILYGPGGIGKGALAASWIVQLVGLGHRILIIDYEGFEGEWARRIASLDSAALSDVRYIAPDRPLTRCAEELHLEVVYEEVAYVVIDSAVMACGDDPMKPETAMRYGEALRRIGVPALTLAHVTKVDDGGKYPFGSVYWQTNARTTWSLMPDGDAAILTHRKHNNYAGLPRQSVTMTWIDGLLREVWERSAVASLADEIAEVLAESPALTVAAVIEALATEERSVSRHSVNSALRRGVGPNGRFTCTQGPAGKVWSLSA